MIMSHLCIRDLVEITGGRLQLGALPPLGGELEPLGRVVVDCQQVRPGDVYWPIGRDAGETAMPEEAFARSALGVVTSGRRVEPWAGKFAIQVDDCHAALRQLVRAVRCRFMGFVVSVAGATGKTTAASWIEQTLAARGPVFRPTPEDSANFDPRSLLELGPEHRCGVFELAADSTDTFTEQSQWISPHCAVLLNAAGGWNESVDLEHAARRLQALRDSLPSHGSLVVNGDDDVINRLTPRRGESIIRIGRGIRCDWAASHIRLADGWLQFVVEGATFRVPASGRHQLYPALAAYAVARLAGISVAEIAQRFAQLETPDATCRATRRFDHTLLCDWPRSRPLAARASLAALRDVHTTGRRIVIAGDLFRHHPRCHPLTQTFGDAAVTRYGADLVIGYGPTGECLVAAARNAGLGERHVHAATNAEDAVEWVRRVWRPEDAVLATGANWDESRRLLDQLVPQKEAAAA